VGRRRRALILALLALVASIAQARELRVCADPNNLPFSKQDGSGFENRIVELIAKDLGAQVRYTWWAQRRGNVRNTLGEGDCDVVPGVASGVEMLSTTTPYYRSTYVFVARAGTRWAKVASLDDAALREAVIGVQLIGDDGSNTPPAQALARRGLVANIRGYTVYGDYADATPQKPLLDAVARGDIDLALAWGPTAGYFARGLSPALHLVPVSPWLDGGEPMVFDISMGVRREDRPLRRELDAALERNRASIARILDDYGVPRLPIDAPAGPKQVPEAPETIENP
jgi:mxaJ protein